MALYNIAKSIGIEQFLKRNLLLYRFSRNVIGRLEVFLPLEPDFRAFRLFPPRGGIFLDVGANDGISARSFRLFNKVTPIVSIEANPVHCKALELLKRKLPGFDYMNIGAGEAPGRLTLQTAVFRGFAFDSYSASDAEQMRFRLKQDFGIAPDDPRLKIETVEVEVKPLDAFGFHPDFIKIDVEGAELPVLRGLVRTIDAHRPIVMIEFIEANFAAMQNFFRPFRYNTYVFDWKVDAFSPFSKQRPDNVFFMTEQQSKTASGAPSSQLR
jgi:FkbM family methyltransferase